MELDLGAATELDGVTHLFWRPAGQPVIHLDGEPVTALTTKQSNDLSKRAGVHTAVVGQVVQYLAADEKLFALSIAELADAVKLINGFHRQLQSGEPVTDVSDFARIARLMVTDLAAPQELGSQLRSATSVQVSGPQARAVLSFLGCYPRFADMLTGTQDGQYGVKVVFGRPEAKKYGDGVYKDGVVKLAPLDTESPYTFLRLLLHEIGHATLERLLLDRKEPPLILDNGTFSTLMTRRAELTALLQRPAPVDQPTRLVRQQAATELAEIEKTIQASGVKPFGEAMSSDGMCFYDAWLVLRKDHGAKLCGLDLGNGRYASSTGGCPNCPRDITSTINAHKNQLRDR